LQFFEKVKLATLKQKKEKKEQRNSALVLVFLGKNRITLVGTKELEKKKIISL